MPQSFYLNNTSILENIAFAKDREDIDLSKVKVDITDDQNSIHINSDSYKKNNSKEKVLIIMDNDTILNLKKNN